MNAQILSSFFERAIECLKRPLDIHIDKGKELEGKNKDQAPKSIDGRNFNTDVPYQVGDESIAA